MQGSSRLNKREPGWHCARECFSSPDSSQAYSVFSDTDGFVSKLSSAIVVQADVMKAFSPLHRQGLQISKHRGLGYSGAHVEGGRTRN